MTDTTTNLHLPLATSGRFSLAASLKAGFRLIDTAIKALQVSVGNIAAPAAEDVTYDHTESGLEATDAKAALDELAARGVPAAEDVTYDHTESGLEATDAKAALDELAARKIIPAFTEADAGKVLTVSAGGAGLEWTALSPA
jgi:1,6-anhydro-N-acetylmuramate kinase